MLVGAAVEVQEVEAEGGSWEKVGTERWAWDNRSLVLGGDMRSLLERLQRILLL